jgi:hypothetical protein
MTSPAHGTLLVNGATATTFTQADIDNGRLSYQQDGSRVTSDSFAFKVDDPTVGETTGSFAISINTVPQVTTQPSDASAFAGTVATFTAAADANPAPDVQWEVSTDGGAMYSPISGANSPTLALKTASGDDGSLYRAVFSNGAGTDISTAAKLTIAPGLVIQSDPASQTAPVGSSIKLTAAAAGSKVHTQWQVSYHSGQTFTNISGARGNGLKVTAGPSTDGAEYRAAFTDAAGTAYTAAASLGVDYTVEVGKTRKLAVAAGTTIHLTASAPTKMPNPAVQWLSSTDGGKTYNPIAGATATTIDLTPTVGDSGTRYRATFTAGTKAVKTAPFTLTVGGAPVVSADPVNTSVAAGGTATFSVSIRGTDPIKVQWQVSLDGGKTFTNVGAATTKTTLTLKKVKAALNGALYRAETFSEFGRAVSDTATLTVA